jgi:phospholipid/cholesterol/gamma-HCH transport system ATP-binding protein
MPRERFASLSDGFGVLLGDYGTYQDRIDRSISLLENLAYALRKAGLDEKSATAKACECASEWDFEEFAADTPDRVDSLVRHRFCLAHALVADPPLAIIDDPNRAFDINHLESGIRSIEGWQARTRGTIMLTTHSIALAKALAYTVAIICAGEIIDFGPPAKLLSGVRDDATFVRRFGMELAVREADPERLEALTRPFEKGRKGFYLDMQRRRY